MHNKLQYACVKEELVIYYACLMATIICQAWVCRGKWWRLVWVFRHFQHK